MGLSTRRAPLVMLMLLIGTSGCLGACATWREGWRAARWRLNQVWSWQASEALTSSVLTGRDAQGAAFVVTRGTHALEVVDAQGKRRAHGSVPSGTRIAVGNTDGLPGHEIVVVTFDEPTVQVYDANLKVLGPSVTLNDVQNTASLALLDLDGDGRDEVLLGDFSGCLTALSYPTFLWDHCIDERDAAQPARDHGDPFALRALVLLRANRERHVLAARPSGELFDTRPDGQPRWRSALPVENLLGLWALDFDGRGRERLLMVSRDVGWRMLDELGAELATGSLTGHVATATPLEWDGEARTQEIVLAHDYGHLSVIGPRVRVDHAPAAGAQILALASADTDGDARDELLAGTSMGHLELLVRSGGAFRSAALDALHGELQAVLAWPAPAKWTTTQVTARAPHFVVAAGRHLSAHRATLTRGPLLYGPWFAGLLTALLLALTLGLLRFGGPELPSLTVGLTASSTPRAASPSEMG